MTAYDIIAKKRDGGELSRAEIEFLVQGFVAGSVPDYQMAAWAMAVFFRGLNARETGDLTLAMVNSGEQMDLSALPGRKIDKHSTGGVGDKTTLVLAPLAAAAGVRIAKMSGRGLGHTGGTLDKLESIPGFRVDLTVSEFLQNVQRLKIAVVGQTGHLVPADKKLYALRDVTATVNSTPLIASSVMSKKIASGADAIVLDVKTGSGAFMPTPAAAGDLARAMVAIGEHAGRETVAFVTNMDQPLGFAVGNALEVIEALRTLKGEGPADLTELCLTLGSEMLVLAGICENSAQGGDLLRQLVRSGAAAAKFKEFVAAQGGNDRVVDDYSLLPQAKHIVPVLATQGGYVQSIAAETIGRCAMRLGAGRETKEDALDLAVGLVLAKKCGEFVSAGEPLAYIHANDLAKTAAAAEEITAAYAVAPDEIPRQPLIYAKITREGDEPVPGL